MIKMLNLQSPHQDKKTMSKPFALIIEDHIHTATIFGAALETAGYETQLIHHGSDAQQALKELVPDIVLLDLHLPQVSGEELLKQIRQDDRLSDTRIVIASADPHLAQELEKKVDLILIKPISFDQLTLLSKRLRPGSTNNL